MKRIAEFTECLECGDTVEVDTEAPEGYVNDGDELICVNCGFSWESVFTPAGFVPICKENERGVM